MKSILALLIILTLSQAHGGTISVRVVDTTPDWHMTALQCDDDESYLLNGLSDHQERVDVDAESKAIDDAANGLIKSQFRYFHDDNGGTFTNIESLCGFVKNEMAQDDQSGWENVLDACNNIVYTDKCD